MSDRVYELEVLRTRVSGAIDEICREEITKTNLNQRLKAKSSLSSGSTSTSNGRAKQQIKLGKGYVEALTDVLYSYSQTFAEDLRFFSQHGKRHTILIEDVLLCARKSQTLHAKLQDFVQENNLGTSSKTKAKPRPKHKAKATTIPNDTTNTTSKGKTTAKAKAKPVFVSDGKVKKKRIGIVAGGTFLSESETDSSSSDDNDNDNGGSDVVEISHVRKNKENSHKQRRPTNPEQTFYSSSDESVFDF